MIFTNENQMQPKLCKVNYLTTKSLQAQRLVLCTYNTVHHCGTQSNIGNLWTNFL